MEDVQIARKQLQKYLEDGYEPILIEFRENVKTEGDWIRLVNTTIKNARDLESVLRAHGFDKEIIVAEVYPNIVTKTEVKWKETRSGKTRRARIKRYATIVGEKEGELYILVPRGAKNLARKFLSLIS